MSSKSYLYGSPRSLKLSFFRSSSSVVKVVQATLEDFSKTISGTANYRNRLAIDLHLLPYYVQLSEAEVPHIFRFQAKVGITSFFASVTVYVIRAHQRLTLAIHAVR